ncbi:MAG: hypothetical protein OEZ25_05820, partial [Candidatus Bathyarchaeota archaeon]|nr:hypothetical protein [Candidatus Bathyarchaeota archaeon]
GGIEPRNYKRLTELEESIKLFGVMKWKLNRKNYLRSRLGSEEYVQSLSALTELEVASKMASFIGRNNVELYPKLNDGGFSDVCLRVNDKKIYLEIGNMWKSLPERKIQKITNASAEYLGKKLQIPVAYLCLIIDTAELVVDDKGRIDVDSSIRKLTSEIDMLALHNIAGFEGFFDFKDMANMVRHRSLYERMRESLSSSDRRLYDLISNAKIQRWLDCFDAKELEKAKLIKGIIAGKGGSTLLVEVHPEKFFPSKASTLEIQSFLKHLVRHVETQIEEGQIQPKAPNIIAVQGFHWIVYGFDLSNLNELYERIQRFFEKRKEKYLSGVVVFQKEIERGAYFSNPYAAKFSELNKEILERIGLTI